MEAIGEVLKIFAEKHLIPSIFSFVLGTIIYLFTPDDSATPNNIDSFTSVCPTTTILPLLYGRYVFCEVRYPKSNTSKNSSNFPLLFNFIRIVVNLSGNASNIFSSKFNNSSQFSTPNSLRFQNIFD